MRHVLGMLAGLTLAAGAGQAMAQVETPANCHWSPRANDPATVEMWCRGDDGQARATGRTLRQAASSADGCPAGKLYDGVRCVSEAQALGAGGAALSDSSGRPATPRPEAGARPRVLMFQDSSGRHRQGLACRDEGNATICRPVPRR